MGKVVETVAKAAIVVAAVATGVGMITGAVAAGGAFAGFAAGTAASYFATTFVSTLVLGAVSAALTKSSAPSIAVTEGTTVTSRQALAPRRIVYGRTRVGGTIVFMQATDSNKYLHMIVTLAGHEIDAVESIYFNDDLLSLDGSGNVSSGTYSGKAKIESKLGTADQTAFANLVSASGGKWTSDHRLRGIACLYIRLEYDSNVYPSGIPNITAVIRGKKVYDPRSATTVWSANPALCVANYITDSVYGIGSDYATEINETALIAAANVCDEDVSLSGGGTENRYESHGAFDSNVTPESVINQMLTSMSGKAIWSGGVWKILAGAYTAPTLVFDEDDLSGGIKVQSLVSRRETFNSIKGVFASPANNYVLTDFPSIVSDTAITADNGEQVWKDVQFPFTTSATMAQRLAKIDLLKARQQITVQLPLKLVGLKAQVGDIVGITNERMGWTSKAFEVTEMGIINGEVMGVEMSLREMASNVYDWSTSEEQAFDPAPNTDLPNPFTVESISGLTAESGEDTVIITGDGTVVPRVLLYWTSPEDQFITSGGQVEIGFKPQTSSNYTTFLIDANNNTAYLSPVNESVNYDIRARYINTNGVKGAYSTTTHIVVGDENAPSAVTGFAIAVHGQNLRFTWNQNTESDLSLYEIRTTDSGWGSTGALFKGQTNTVLLAPNGLDVAVTYYIKAADFSGNYSTVASAAYTVQSPSNIASLTETFSDTALTNATVTLDWSDVSPTFGLDYYEVTYNGTTKNIKASTITLPADWIGSRLFTVKVVDLLGHKSSGFSKSVTKLVPNPVSNLMAQVIDNNVLLFWDLPSKTTLPIQHIILKKGSTYAGATELGTKDGGFTSLQELQAGEFTYWVTVVDTDGYESTETGVTAQVAAPPDFIFFADYTSDLSGTYSSAVKEDTTVILPVNTTETWETHFTSRSWSTPQNQIDAGYPIFIQPANGSGYYQEVIDYGTVLASSKVTVNVTGEVVSGSPTLATTISISEDGTTYTDYPNVTAIYATNFRYIKIKIAVTESTGTGLYKITNIETVLDAKLKNDGGSVYANSGDSTGTQVNFGVTFIDITSLTATPSGTSLLTAVVDFTDAPNPTGFKVYLFDSSGNRASGTVYWNAKGY